MRSMFDIAKSYVGERLIIRGKDYGIVTEFFSVDNEYGLLTDHDIRLRLSSVLRALNSNITDAVYPEGTAYSKYFAGAKKLYRAEAYGAANIPNTAFARDKENAINISKRPGNGK